MKKKVKKRQPYQKKTLDELAHAHFEKQMDMCALTRDILDAQKKLRKLCETISEDMEDDPYFDMSMDITAAARAIVGGQKELKKLHKELTMLEAEVELEESGQSQGGLN